VTNPNQLSLNIAALKSFANPLREVGRGIEREALRVTPLGHLSRRGHSKKLGASLTHPHITTDYAESLLEFVTPPLEDVDQLLHFLESLINFTYQRVGGELLWPISMPCSLGGDDDIEIARYGNSNLGRLKRLYRQGLQNRYGSMMQIISGVHYNFSFGRHFWDQWQEQLGPKLEQQQFKNQQYFNVIRNLRHYNWLLYYLFGASPTLCQKFIQRPEQRELVEPFDSEGSLYGPYATTFRMSDLGYQNSAQSSIDLSFNSLDDYVEVLKRAMNRVHPPFAKMGVKRGDQYLQISDTILQVENEFYTQVRPKRPALSDELPTNALQERGVEYLELRMLDVNPFSPVGITADQIYFLDILLFFSLLQPAPEVDSVGREMIDHNNRQVALFGRRPGLKLETANGPTLMSEVAYQLFDQLREVATLLDGWQGDGRYLKVLEQERAKIENPELTPSGQMVREMREEQLSFSDYAMDLATSYRQKVMEKPLEEMEENYLLATVRDSLLKERELVASDHLNFESYLKDYLRNS
jgi:glutamate--cysteine ligase